MNGRRLSVLMALMFFASFSLAEPRIDSVSIEPSYVAAGYDINVNVKVSEGLVKRNLYSAQRQNGSKIPQQDKQAYYVGTFSAKNRYTNQQAIITEPQRDIGHLFSGESWTVPFNVKIKEDTDPVNLTFSFKILRADRGNEILISKDITVPVEASIKLNVESDSKIDLGSNTINVWIENVGGGTARRTSAQLNSSGYVKVVGSNSVYLGDLGYDERVKISYSLLVDAQTPLGAYNIPFRVTYLDRSGSTVTENVLLGLDLDSSPSIDVSAEATQTLVSGTQKPVTLEVINNGFVDLQFLSLQLLSTKQYEVVGKNKHYIGDLDSDDTETEDFKIKILDSVDSGDLVLNAKVYFKKENQQKDHVQAFNPKLEVLSNQDYQSMQTKATSSSSLLIGLLALPALILGYLLLWVLFKVVGLITSKLNHRFFQRRRD